MVKLEKFIEKLIQISQKYPDAEMRNEVLFVELDIDVLSDKVKVNITTE